MKTRKLVPFTILAAIILAGSALYLILLQPKAPPQRTVEIEMTTFQWSYNPVNVTVRLGDLVVIRVRNLDVPHGFVIDAFRVSVFLPPGETVTVKFVADQIGTFVFYCNVFCGEGHPKHRGTLTVTT